MDDPIPLRVRAGSTNPLRTLLYVVCGLLVGGIVGYAVVATFGGGRILTAVLVGLIIGVAVIIALRASFSIILDEGRIVVRQMLHRDVVAWDQVDGITAAANAAGDGRRELWTFAMTSIVDGTKRSDTLVEIPPVEAPYSNAYEFNKRQQIIDIVALANKKAVPLYVPSRIGQALKTHWHVDTTD